MEITKFKEDDIITRVESTTRNDDRSYMGDKLLFVGVEKAKIVLISLEKYDQGRLVELSTDWWSDGWDFYPKSLMQKAKTKVKKLFPSLSQ